MPSPFYTVTLYAVPLLQSPCTFPPVHCPPVCSWWWSVRGEGGGVGGVGGIAVRHGGGGIAVRGGGGRVARSWWCKAMVQGGGDEEVLGEVVVRGEEGGEGQGEWHGEGDDATKGNSTPREREEGEGHVIVVANHRQGEMAGEIGDAGQCHSYAAWTSISIRTIGLRVGEWFIDGGTVKWQQRNVNSEVGRSPFGLTSGGFKREGAWGTRGLRRHGDRGGTEGGRRRENIVIDDADDIECAGSNST
ncbi:hypothetical protein BDQ17DRAFT_1336870 [Cyathus striatus]|nr:hypothetical protein BDQ17DRAFT_1336870 [Cyathus striatus]